MGRNNKSKRHRREASKRAAATAQSMTVTQAQEIDRSLQNLDQEEEHLKKRIEAITEKLEKIKRARIKKRLEKETLEKKREKALQPPAESRADEQKLLLDQLNEAIKAQMARNQAEANRPSELSAQPREIQKVILDKMNNAIKNNLVADQRQTTNEEDSDNRLNMSSLLATLMDQTNTEEASGSGNGEQTLDEAAGGSYYYDEPDSTN